MGIQSGYNYLVQRKNYHLQVKKVENLTFLHLSYFRIKYMRPDYLQYLNGDRNRYSVAAQTKDEMQPKLTINTARVGDTGEYQCKVFHVDGSVTERDTNLSILCKTSIFR